MTINLSTLVNYSTKIHTDEIGVNVAPLDGNGLVPSANLPSYVDDVLEFADLASFPATGDSGVLYLAIDTRLIYRWTGTVYVGVNVVEIGETSQTAYRGDRGKIAYDHSQANGNPHGATTADVNDSTNKRYVTDAQSTVISNTSGTNTGDETSASIRAKVIREDASFMSSSIANGSSYVSTVTIATLYQLLHITTSHPCRVRLYTSTSQRDNDLARSIGVDPTGNHGLMFEYVSTNTVLSADLSPVVDGFATTTSIPFSIVNLSGSTQTIAVILNHIKTGA